MFILECNPVLHVDITEERSQTYSPRCWLPGGRQPSQAATGVLQRKRTPARGLLQVRASPTIFEDSCDSMHDRVRVNFVQGP